MGHIKLWVLGVLTVAACGDDAGTLPDAGPLPDASPPAMPCVAPTGAGTQHSGELTADETWTAAESQDAKAVAVKALKVFANQMSGIHER